MFLAMPVDGWSGDVLVCGPWAHPCGEELGTNRAFAFPCSASASTQLCCGFQTAAPDLCTSPARLFHLQVPLGALPGVCKSHDPQRQLLTPSSPSLAVAKILQNLQDSFLDIEMLSFIIQSFFDLPAVFESFKILFPLDQGLLFPSCGTPSWC